MKYLIILLLFINSAFADSFSVDGPCQVYFSPSGGSTDAIVKLIDSAHANLRMLAYNFTSARIGDALVAAHKRGVDVELVLDKSVPTERNSALPTMLAAGIPVWIDSRHKIAHNKVIIVDDAWVETGSFNYTDNAENSNGENTLICPSRDGAGIYSKNWELHKSHSEVAP